MTNGRLRRKPRSGPAAGRAAEYPAGDHDKERADRRGSEQRADRLAIRHSISGFRQSGIKNTAVDDLDDHHDNARCNESGHYGCNASQSGAHGTSSALAGTRVRQHLNNVTPESLFQITRPAPPSKGEDFAL